MILSTQQRLMQQYLRNSRTMAQTVVETVKPGMPSPGGQGVSKMLIVNRIQVERQALYSLLMKVKGE